MKEGKKVVFCEGKYVLTEFRRKTGWGPGEGCTDTLEEMKCECLCLGLAFSWDFPEIWKLGPGEIVVWPAA